MNQKTLKILKKFANIQIPGKVYEDKIIELYRTWPEKEKKELIKQMKIIIMLHNN